MRNKSFLPSFTTIPIVPISIGRKTGEGTGQGLSLSYYIVKAPGGVLPIDIGTIGMKVKTEEGEGTEFIIQLPMYQT